MLSHCQYLLLSIKSTLSWNNIVKRINLSGDKKKVRIISNGFCIYVKANLKKLHNSPLLQHSIYMMLIF